MKLICTQIGAHWTGNGYEYTFHKDKEGDTTATLTFTIKSPSAFSINDEIEIPVEE